MKFKLNETLIVGLLAATFIGCAHFPTTTRTISIEGLQPKEILELAVDAGRAVNFPETTKFDAVNGIVEFGAFGLPVTGVTAQVRVRSDNRSIDITVKRGSVYVPLPVKETMNKFSAKFQELLEQKMRRE